ncbi:hypothetical protein M407DRAFT_227263 [Tulasnella calospora MUT 4182]|uniref:DUF4246 domain-containing protein n=1 Tax=Tulasnella calospora MUT 4182 TaxID=1051891 RepID=A0A0C3LJ40_9AGAM|nr:hypothetical protein M407DRAFT_227263 [Tulasnella calospora MUT 4182]
MSYHIRSKPSWWTKYKDETIRSKWKAEALETPVSGENLLEPEVDYVLDELAGYNKMRDEATGIQQSCFSRIYESDSLIPQDLLDRLKAAVKILEDVPEDQKDWHPRSDDQVLDLVHPSLYPIVYGRTFRYPEVTKPGDRKIADFQPIIAPNSSTTPGEDWSFSKKFAWLSTDFKIAKDGSSAKAVSYINNLHPSHTELYSVIEALVARFSFLFDRVLTDLVCYSESSNRRIIEDYSYKDDDDDGPERLPDETQQDYEIRVENWKWERPMSVPTVLECGCISDISFRSKSHTIQGKEVQVIVKLANIHLTPEKPFYPGDSWHVEGMANERILASGIYYYDSENISESELQFRTVVTAADLSHEEDDAIGVQRVWGLERFGPANQIVGATPTPAGRCLAFPNIYQHKVAPFWLEDETKPGYRKILALFLLDPEHPRFSTTDILPQQAEWYELAMQQAPATSPFRKLPAEIMREITRQLPNLMTLDEAKKYRLELMDERTAFVGTQDERYFASDFNFCEH